VLAPSLGYFELLVLALISGRNLEALLLLMVVNTSLNLCFIN
jgi:hypothetical protein